MSLKVSVHFYLHHQILRNGTQRIMGRITANRQKSEFATDYSVKPLGWNIKEGCFLKNNAANEELQKLKAKIFEYKSYLTLEGKAITAKRLRDLLMDKASLRFNLVQYFEEFIAAKRKSTDLSPQRIRHYDVTLKYLTEFVENELGGKDIPIKEFDYAAVVKWDAYLRRQTTNQYGHKMALSTLNSHHTRLKTLLNKAFREGIIAKSPFLDFKLKKEDTLPKYLTKEELQNIEKHELGGNASLKGVRDVFVFSCYTGLRFNDAQKLRVQDIQKGEDKTYSIEIRQQKTGNEVYVPLLPKAMDIIRKYENSDERKLTGSVLPQISNVKTNAYLKVIQDLVGIRTKLTHNVARHTFATTVLLDAGIPLEVTSKLLGHSKISTTQIYAKVTKNKINAALNGLK